MISFEIFPAYRRASIVAIEMKGKKRSVTGAFIPEKILIVGQFLPAKTGVVAGTPFHGFTADDYGVQFGYGSEIHRQALHIFAALGGFSENVYGVAVPAISGGVAGTGTITFVGAATSAGTEYFSIGGDLYQIGVISGDTAVIQAAALVAAITANINSAVSAAIGGTGSEHIVTLTHKQLGVNGNEIEAVYNPAGVTQANQNPSGAAITMPATGFLTSGSGNAVTTGVFIDSEGGDKLGGTWYTFITCPYKDATNIAVYKTAANARGDPSVKKMFATVIGYTTEAYSAFYAIPATINSKFITPVWEARSLAPGLELAASVIGTCAYSATIDPGRPFKTLAIAIPVTPDVSDLADAKLDALFRAGGGFFKLDSSGGLILGDIPMSYRTTATGAASEEWFDLVSVTRRQQKVYDIDQLFNSEPYTRGMVGSDDVVTGKDYVIKPKTVIAALCALVDAWASEGWTKYPETVKDSIAAEINATNNSRIDAEITDDEAQALRIIAIKYAFLY